MADTDRNSTAWKVPPGSYREQRGVDWAVPAKPVSQYVTMPDGVRLAVDVWLPAAKPGGPARPAKVPAVMVLTPYYRRFQLKPGAPAGTECSPGTALYREALVPAGYALVTCDVRGTGASFGSRAGFRSPAERDDYGHLISWIVAQDWSDGGVGATGISYLGAASDFAASTGHPAVKAIAPLFSVWDTYADHICPGGVPLKTISGPYGEALWALDVDHREVLRRFANWKDPNLDGPQPVDEDADGTLAAAAVREHAANFHIRDYLAEFQCRDDALLYDPSFTPAAFSPYTYSKHVREDVAVMSVSGWYDGAGYAHGTIARFLTLPNPKRYLLLGPWDHGARINVSPWRAAMKPEFPLMSEVLRFFDQHLLGREAGLSAEAPVHYFSMHDEKWRSASAWPPLASTRTLHLVAGNKLSDEPAAAGIDEKRADYAFTTGTQTRFERVGVIDTSDYYHDWHGRDEALLHYDSAPLAKAAEMSGHVIVRLWLESSEPDVSLHVYLSEIEADGRSRYVTEGVLRAVHRETAPHPPNYKAAWPWRAYSRAGAKPMPKGRAEELVFSMLPVSWGFAKGSRLRFSISGADSEHFLSSPFGRPPLLRVHRGPGKASTIELPWREEA